MRHLRASAAAAAVLILLPTTASAQSGAALGAGETDTKPTPEQIASARAEADAAIASANVGDLFENSTDSLLPSARHKLSGMDCSWDPETGVSFTVYDGSPRGDDVSCSTKTLGATYTLYATRYPKKPTARDVVQSSVDNIRTIFTDVKPFEGTLADVGRDDGQGPEIVTFRMSAKLQGRPVFTRSAAVVIGDWVVAHRATGASKDAMTIDLMAGLTLLMTSELMQDQAKSAANIP